MKVSTASSLPRASPENRTEWFNLIVSRIRSSFRAYQLSIVVAAAIAIPAVLAYLGFRSTQEWQRSTRSLAQQRTSEVATLMIMALNRDMRAVQGEVLPQLDSLNSQSSLFTLSDEVTAAFARFPYPESFFTWRANGTEEGDLYVFNRTNRPPHWHRKLSGANGFPTAILKNPPELQPLVHSLRMTDYSESHLVARESQLQGGDYQIVAEVRYAHPYSIRIESLVGFTVNLTWAREHYFSDLLRQFSKVLGVDPDISIAIFDDRDTLVSASPRIPQSSTQSLAHEQHFPLLFFDPLLRTTPEGEFVPLRYWAVKAQPIQGESTLVASRGASRTLILISFAALAAGVALIFAIISVRAAVVLASMKSEFVASVTHELKTPLSSIRLASETLVRGRYRSKDVIVEHGELLLNEVSRLTRTVDNLLSITRVQDVTGLYLFESIDLLTLVEEALSRFELQLRLQDFEVHVAFPPSLPYVLADRSAILQVLENLLDNAIRYSHGSRYLDLSASLNCQLVTLRIADKGPGIPSDELPWVFEKFFRGRRNLSPGSGLGLAIAKRILKDHGGAIRLHSVEGQGTIAEVILRVSTLRADAK